MPVTPRYLILFFVVFFSSKLAGQAPYYYTLNEENGLPSSEIYQVLQDKEGFIWVGCDAGLFRYDGTKFKQYNYRKENGKSISDLNLDYHGKLWCQNFTGQLFRVEKDSLFLFKDFSGAFRNYPQFTVDEHDNVWITGQTTIEQYNKNGELVGKYGWLANTGDSVTWMDVEIGSDKQIYATSQQAGLFKFTFADGIYKPEPIESPLKRLYKPFLQKVNSSLFVVSETDEQKKYIVFEIGINSGLKKINTGEFIYKIASLSDGTRWLATSSGVIPLTNYNNATPDTGRVLFSGDKISNLFEDREGNLWLTSLQNGIHIIPNKNLLIYNHQNSGLNDNVVTCLAFGLDNKLMLGTYSGNLFEMGINKKLYTAFKNDANDLRAVRKILPYNQGFLVARGSFWYLSPKQKVALSPGNVRDFGILNDTMYYVSSNSVSMLCNVSRLTQKSSKKILPLSIIDKSGRSMAIDSIQRAMYFATINGLVKYQGGKLSSLSYLGERINAIKLTYAKGTLWIGSINNGILVYEGNGVKAKSEINKLIKGKTIKTFKITQDYIFIATEKCLNKISLNGNLAGYYDVADGLVSKEINSIEINDNTIYLATNKGLISFPLSSESSNRVAPEINIDGIWLNEEKINSELSLKNIPYNNLHLKISFITSCIKARGNFYYAYRLLNSDTAWTVVNAFNNQVLYNALLPGNYTFEVKAINEDGVESKTYSRFEFSVAKPFWQQWWFYILIGLSGALLVLLISLIIIRNIKYKALIKNELITSQLTAIRAQMNPHFMYNTLNSIQDLILKSDIKNTNHYLSRFSNLMRKVLQFSSMEKVPVAEEIDMLENYLELEKLRFGNEFNFSIDCNEQINKETDTIPSLIIQPFVENALKHGLLHKKGEKHLSINFAKKENQLLITITDNGVGRKRSEEIKSRSGFNHSSFATGAVQRRLELINQNYKSQIKFNITDLVENENPIGTRIEIFVSF